MKEIPMKSTVYVVWTVDALGGIVVKKVFDSLSAASRYHSSVHDIVLYITTAPMVHTKAQVDTEEGQ